MFNGYPTVDGCEILHHQEDGWKNMLKPQQNNGMFTIYQLVQDFAGPSTVCKKTVFLVVF